MTRTISIALLCTVCVPMLAVASPNPFGDSKAACTQLAQEKYDADMAYILENLDLVDSVPIQTVRDVRKYELQSCNKTLY